MTTNTARAPHALTELTEEEQDAVAGGAGGRELTCDVAGGLSGIATGIVAGAAFGPVGGSIAGTMVGSAVKTICLNTYDNTPGTLAAAVGDWFRGGGGGGGGRAKQTPEIEGNPIAY